MNQTRTGLNRYEVLKLTILAGMAVMVAVAVFARGGNAAQAQGMPVVGGSNYVFLATASSTQGGPALFIIDPSTRRFAYYTRRQNLGENQFMLHVARNFSQDLEFDDVSKSSNGYSVKDMRNFKPGKD